MNKEKLSEMRYKRVRVFPVPRRFNSGVELEQIDDVWLITNTSRERLELRNPRSDQHVGFGTDHVREFMTDFGRSDGVLVLKSQIFLVARQMPRIEPLNPSLNRHW
jgi:hypothetical protein